MGQSQLLLLVLGVVLVGLSVVLGIGLFGEKQKQALFDDMTVEANKVSGEMIAWRLKPVAFGGGSGVEYLTGLTMNALGFDANGSGSKANNDQYWRSINKVNTKRPIVVFRPKANGDLRIQLYMYGDAPNCFKLRRSERIDGSWVVAGIPVGVNKAPDGCSTW